MPPSTIVTHNATPYTAVHSLAQHSLALLQHHPELDVVLLHLSDALVDLRQTQRVQWWSDAVHDTSSGQWYVRVVLVLWVVELYLAHRQYLNHRPHVILTRELQHLADLSGGADQRADEVHTREDECERLEGQRVLGRTHQHLIK